MKMLALALLAFLAISYFFWAHYLVFSAFKAAKDAGRAIPRIAIALVAPILVTGFSIDVVYNATLGSLLFLEIPRTWTLTARCSSHLKDDTWRGALARWFCAKLLDPFQTGGHCH
jgi:hypothetical protein